MLSKTNEAHCALGNSSSGNVVLFAICDRGKQYDLFYGPGTNLDLQTAT